MIKPQSPLTQFIAIVSCIGTMVGIGTQLKGCAQDDTVVRRELPPIYVAKGDGWWKIRKKGIKFRQKKDCMRIDNLIKSFFKEQYGIAVPISQGDDIRFGLNSQDIVTRIVYKSIKNNTTIEINRLKTAPILPTKYVVSLFCNPDHYVNLPLPEPRDSRQSCDSIFIEHIPYYKMANRSLSQVLDIIAPRELHSILNRLRRYFDVNLVHPADEYTMLYDNDSGRLLVFIFHTSGSLRQWHVLWREKDGSLRNSAQNSLPKYVVRY